MVNNCDVSALLREHAGLQPAFQPIVELSTGQTVGAEALARWPQHPDLSPTDVFDAARAAGVGAELDLLCRRRAVDTAEESGFSPDQYLFLNVEPYACADGIVGGEVVTEIIDTSLRIVLELTERHLLDDPAAVMATVVRARRRGFAIALDDVGAEPDCLALLDVICPDVIKLDRSVTQMTTPGLDYALALNSAVEAARRTGATLLAEGIENSAHAVTARTMGAVLGQGYAYGRPDTISQIPPPDAPAPTLVDPHRGAVTPLGDILAEIPHTVDTLDQILRTFEAVETVALTGYRPGCIVAEFNGARQFGACSAAQYKRLAARHLYVGVAIPGAVQRIPHGVVRPATPGFPARDQFALASIGADHAVALIAQPVGPESAREYRWAISSDRSIVARIARSLLFDLSHAR